MRLRAIGMSFVILGVAAAYAGAGLGHANAGCGTKPSMEGAVAGEPSNVATAAKAGTILLQNEDDASALELTACPLALDASAYLVQVFVGGGGVHADTAPELLGSFAFFPPRVGQPQTFVLPTPSALHAGSSKDLTVSIKLVSANALRELKDSAVAITDARLVK